MDLVQVRQHYIATHTHITIALREQVIYVISHHILLKSLEAMVTWPVKKCSSDQTVTPLIRVGSDWRLWKGKWMTLGVFIKDVLTYSDDCNIITQFWYVTNEHFTQWIDYWIESNSIFTLNVILSMEKKSLLEWDSIQFWNWISAEEKNTRKMTLVTHGLINYHFDR